MITQTEVQLMPSIDMIDKETKDESNTNSGGMMLLQCAMKEQTKIHKETD